MARDLFSARQLRFIGEPRIGRLATVRADGSPHIAPVWYRFEDGAFLVLTERGSQKHRNVEREPRAEFCIDDERPPYHTVIVRGRVAVTQALGAAWREALAIHYLGEEAGRRYVGENPDTGNILLRMVPEKVVGW
jgi:PPOX class probable F420-dependent enzyme